MFLIQRHIVSRMREAERRWFNLQATIYRGGFEPKRSGTAYHEGGVLELILILTF